MITSLLSLYITSVISPNLGNNFQYNIPDTTPIVRATSFDFSSLGETDSIPIKNPEFIAPIINAKSTIAIDLKTGTILYEKNAHQRVSIASITKLMTILIILEENDLSEEATVSQNAATTTGSTMFLRAGEKITLENLLYGALINSANDAAVALAEHNAGSTKDFVEKMNKKALSLGLVNTKFSNPIGLDESNNYSSAYDVAKLAKYVYQKQLIRTIAAIKETKVSSVDGAYTHELKSTNELLDNELYKFKGLKTGQTDAAGLCLSSIAENDEGNEIITVVLNSPARFTETKILVDWVFRAYNW